MTIEELRKKISAIDERLVVLLDERISLVREIGNIKTKNSLPIIDKEREKEIYDNLSKIKLKNTSNEDIIKIFEKIIEISIAIQKDEIKISFLGPSGTYTEQAARNFFLKENAKFLPEINISEVFRSVENEEADYGVIAIENSTAGSVGENLDMLVESNLFVCGEIIEKIKHCLITKSELLLKDIKQIYSHPQPFSQCRQFLEANFQKTELIPTKSTANAVEIIKNKENAAAIGSELAAKQNNLIILKKGIEDIKNNFTRFFVIGKKMPQKTNNDKTSIVFTVKHEPGALLKVLEAFSKRNINLTKLESRPLKTNTWEYLFFLDFIGNVQDENSKKALDDINQKTIMLKILGSYAMA
ncbi:MAG: prephenate dehydratase [Candidatus Lokiarchaeota archaeon]|nr:prephenate dehydratase [Candidatus Lokiarchaeota archaeon]